VTETLPYAWYTDEELLRRERSLIFARSWQYAGRAAQVEQPGSFLATDAGGIPIVVTRDENGELRAFLNVCRHRGAVLTEDCGERSTIQCRYHAWTYELDGSLRTAPRSEREPGFDKAQWSLVPASSDTWGPFLFVNPDADAVPLAEHLGELPQILARDIDVDELAFHSRVEFGANANWKIVVENFLECYHCATAHPAFSAEVDVHPDRYLLEAHPTFNAQYCRAKSTGEQGQFHLLYPNPASTSFQARPTFRSGRSGRPDRDGPSAFSTTSSHRMPTRRGSVTSSRSMTRSARRTRCSSSRCTVAWPPASSSTDSSC
jgi:choline monooxygenase